MLDETYSLRLVTNFLKEKNIDFEYSNANIGFDLNDHGCRVKLNDTYSLSIQTHPMVVGSSFAETALQNMVIKKIVYNGTYDYYDAKRFEDPQELFDHLVELFDNCK
jgi:hypothetical protein